MSKLFVFGLLCVVSTGCAPLLVGAGIATSAAAARKTPDQAVEINKNNLSSLTYGSSRKFTREIMGERPLLAYRDKEEIRIPNPYRTENFKDGPKSYQVWFYATSVISDDDQFTDEELTPLVFQDGILIGWGWDAYRDVRK